MSNPLVSQGVLNRLIASATFPSNPTLNVTASFLNREGIRLALDGEATRFLPTLTGAVTSPEPYMMVTMTLSLLRTQSLAAAYKAAIENQTTVGGCVVRPDSAVLPVFNLNNVALESIRELGLNGEDAGFSVTCRGYYNINNFLWT